MFIFQYHKLKTHHLATTLLTRLEENSMSDHTSFPQAYHLRIKTRSNTKITRWHLNSHPRRTNHESLQWEREQSEVIRIRSDQGRTIENQVIKIFPKSHHSLSKISTDVSVPILETLLRLGLYTWDLWTWGSDTILSHPKSGCDGTCPFPTGHVSLTQPQR